MGITYYVFNNGGGRFIAVMMGSLGFYSIILFIYNK